MHYVTEIVFTYAIFLITQEDSPERQKGNDVFIMYDVCMQSLCD